MVGVDITKISRFKNASDNLVARILHPIEVTNYYHTENKELFLARHWAIKEALFKADNSLVNFNQILIRQEGRKYFFNDFEISTSHEDDFYIAFVLKR